MFQERKSSDASIQHFTHTAHVWYSLFKLPHMSSSSSSGPSNSQNSLPEQGAVKVYSTFCRVPSSFRLPAELLATSVDMTTNQIKLIIDKCNILGCDAKTTITCGRCKLVPYCCAAHRDQDVIIHDQWCVGLVRGLQNGTNKKMVRR